VLRLLARRQLPVPALVRHDRRLADRPLRRPRGSYIEPGDAFYMSPGHVPAAQAGSEFVMFSPQGELAVSEAALKANMQRLMQGT
jgi:hypothetical protein